MPSSNTFQVVTLSTGAFGMFTTYGDMTPTEEAVIATSTLEIVVIIGARQGLTLTEFTY